MEQSPLTHQPRPEVFQPKIVQLYDELLRHPDDILDEGFWTEFFLLRPDRRALRRRINALTADDLLALEAQTRQLFARAVAILVWGSALPGHGHSHGNGPGNGHGHGHPNGHHKNGAGSGAHHSSRAPGRLASSIPDWPPASYPSVADPSAAGFHALLENTLATLTTFLSAALAKRYNNPSADVIDMLAGLDRVDAVLSDFVAALDQLMRAGPSPTCRARAVDVALAVTAGAYQTTLLTYFIQRDIFQAVMKVIAGHAGAAAPSFTLIGLLANYNKFEFQNPYQLRLGDFVNEDAIKIILWGVGDTCQKMRSQYIDIQDDSPEGGWLLEKAWGMLGFGSSSSSSSSSKPPPKPVYDAETARQMLAELPGDEAPVLLATYDFTHANKLFSFNLVSLGPRVEGKDDESRAAAAAAAADDDVVRATGFSREPPIASIISLTSYLLQNAYRSPRTTLYAHLSLMVFRLLVEDPVLCKRLCGSDDASKVAVRLCRQRAPHLPVVKAPRALAASILDAMVDGITHNLRKRLDVGLYTQCVGIMLRLVAYLSRTRTRLPYRHWPELFRALLSLVRFLTTYAADLRSAAGADNPQHLETLVDHVVNLLALSLSAGEAFLPTPAAYDDLFYKVVETGEVLDKFKATYRIGGGSGSGSSSRSSSIDTLLSVSAHYKQLLAEGAKGGKGGRVTKGSSTLTSMQVAEVIKQGYETLSIQATEGLDGWDKYREADERSLLKKLARTAVADVKLHIEKD